LTETVMNTFDAHPDYEALFAPLELSSTLTLPNRLVMAPMTTTSGESDGRFSEQEISYLKRRADAGIGLIMTAACYCHKSGHSFERQVGCHSDEMSGRLEECARAVNEAGSASFLQIHHGGNAAKQALAGTAPRAPSAVHNRQGTSELPTAMTVKLIWDIVEAFARAAGRAQRAGFTGVELHGANTSLFQQFFSAFTNKRDDEWGAQTLENRTRFAREVVTAVRSEVGGDYPVAYRISPEEPEPYGYSMADVIPFIQGLVENGVDVVHVSSWEYGVGLRDDYPEKSHPTLEIRKALPERIPVIGVGGIMHPSQARAVLDDGVDLVALGRALLLDADWAEKVRSGHVDDIRAGLTDHNEIEQLEIPSHMKEYVARFFLD
jgi:2,4-dienoyl-CoA reductase-like NADH-dependent reductase (Old Yellow Enzyme family)